jgi:hypothetical protein
MAQTGSIERWSTEWLVQSGYVGGIGVGVLSAFFTVLLQARGSLPAGVVIIAVGLLAGFAIGTAVARGMLQFGGRMAAGVYAPTGTASGHAPSFSHIETLVIRGDLDGAAAAWEVAVLEHPESAFVLMKAADFHLRSRKNPRAALEYFDRARALGSGNRDLRLYVQQQIIDVYLGPLNDPGRAMGELRRLIEAFPGTREAEAARTALAAIKKERADPLGG